MAANTRIEANAVDDLLSIQSLHFCICIKLVKVGNAQRQIGIAEQLNSLCFGEAHEQGVNVLFDCTLLQQAGKGMRSLHQALILQVGAHDNAARVQVIVQCFAFAQKFRAENDVLATGFFTDAFGVANGNGGFDYHNRIGVVLHNQLDYCFYSAGVEKVLFAVVVGRCSDDNKFCILIGHFCIQRSNKVEVLFSQIFFNIIILNRGFFVVDQFNLLRDNINGLYFIVLRKQRSQGKTNVTGTGNGNFHVHHTSLFI